MLYNRPVYRVANIELQVNWNDNSGGEIEASLIQFF